MSDYKDKIITVWGSPHSGKTTFALKLGQALYEKTRAAVVVLFCDVTTPTIPVLFPNFKTAELCSVGTVLSKPDIYANDVVSNLITVKERGNLGFLGYKNKENRFSFPEYDEGKVHELFTAISEIADYIIVDCESVPTSSVLTEFSLKNAEIMIKLCTPDLSCIGFYQSQHSLMLTGKYYPDKILTIMNVPSADLTMLASDAAMHVGNVDIIVPYSGSVRDQYLEGRLYQKTWDRKFTQAVEKTVEAVRAYGAV